MITNYLYNDIRAIISDGDYLWIAFGTNPTIIYKVSKLSPSVPISQVVLDEGYYNVSSMILDGSNLWVLCELAPGKIVVINTSTLVKTNITMTRNNPIIIGKADGIMAIGINDTPNYQVVYNSATFSYITETEVPLGIAYDTYADGTYNWTPIYTTSGDGILVRQLTSYPYTPTYFSITGFDKIISISKDDSGALWLGSNTSPGKIAKVVITGTTVDSIDIFTFNSGENIVKEIQCLNGFIWCILTSSNKLIKAWEESGGILDWTAYTINSTSTLTYSTVMDVDSNFVSVGMLDTPGKLYQLNISQVYHFDTDLRTRLAKYFTYLTDLRYIKRLFSHFDTDVRTKYTENKVYQTDIRFSSAAYDSIQPKSLMNFIVYKDGTELADVDYSSLRFTFNLNNTPSSAEFTLARRHDDYNKTIAGVSSIIDEENKITIYDGTKLLFTGYINQITCNSENDTVNIKAEDVRYKISRESMELEYGGKYDSDTKLITIINTKTALTSVFTYISSLISGYDAIEFGFVPEYSKEFNDCGTLIDNLVRNSANINWYVDENERIRFQKISNGTVKTLDLCGINTQRHIYDVVLNNIVLNRRTSNYYTAFEVQFGKNLVKRWSRSSGHPNLDSLPSDYVKELSWYGFQTSNKPVLYGTSLIYVGENIAEIVGYETTGFWVRGNFIYQWLATDSELDISSVVVGSGDIKKTIYMTSYGKQSVNSKYEERVDEITDLTYLWETTEENYDNTAYAIDAATFDLSQNNKLLTEAQISLVLDAFEYYNLSFKDLINLNNTIDINTFYNHNGFPLNISSYSIDAATRLVTLSLTNYGKTAYTRIGNIMGNYTAPKEYRRYRKYNQIAFSSGL